MESQVFPMEQGDHEALSRCYNLLRSVRKDLQDQFGGKPLADRVIEPVRQAEDKIQEVLVENRITLEREIERLQGHP